MKVLLAIVVVAVFALSLLADYKWRKWTSQRRAEHQNPQDRSSGKRQ